MLQSKCKLFQLLLPAAPSCYPPPYCRLHQAQPKAEGACLLGRATMWRAGSGDKQDKHVNPVLFLLLFFFFPSETVTISCWSPQTWQSRHSNTEQVVQHLCALTTCLCHITPCSDLARTEEQQIGKAQRGKYRAYFQFARGFIRTPAQEGMDKFNPPVRSRNSFVTGSTMGDLEQQKGWGRVRSLRVPAFHSGGFSCFPLSKCLGIASSFCMQKAQGWKTHYQTKTHKLQHVLADQHPGYPLVACPKAQHALFICNLRT